MKYILIHNYIGGAGRRGYEVIDTEVVKVFDSLVKASKYLVSIFEKYPSDLKAINKKEKFNHSMDTKFEYKDNYLIAVRELAEIGKDYIDNILESYEIIEVKK